MSRIIPSDENPPPVGDGPPLPSPHHHGSVTDKEFEASQKYVRPDLVRAHTVKAVDKISRRASAVDVVVDQAPRIASAKNQAGIHYPANGCGQCCITLDPRDKYMMRWDGLVIVLLIFTAYVTPYEVAFLSTKLNGMFYLNRFIDLAFFLDLCKNFLTAYFDAEEQYWVGDSRKIAKKYLKSWFTVDLVSILPFDSVGIALQSDEMQEAQGIRLIRVLRLLKLMRLLRSLRILSRWQDQLGLTYVFRTFTKFVVLLLTMTHWMACMMRLIPDLFEYTNGEGEALSWLTKSEVQYYYYRSPKLAY
jgi:hypothetical protein